MSHVQHLSALAQGVDAAHPQAPRIASAASTPDVALGGATGATGDAGWRGRYARRLLVGDLTVLLAAIAAAQMVKFGSSPAPAVDGLSVSYPALGVLLAITWWASLQVHRVRSRQIIGHGAEEYRRVVVATFRVFALLAMLSVALKIDASRVYLATAFPLGLAGLLIERKIARAWLHRARNHGSALEKVLVVGGERSATSLARWFARHPANGYVVSWVWVPDSAMPLTALLDGATRHVPVM